MDYNDLFMNLDLSSAEKVSWYVVRVASAFKDLLARAEAAEKELADCRERNAGLALALLTEQPPNPDCLGDQEWQAARNHVKEAEARAEKAERAVAELMGISPQERITTCFGHKLDRVMELVKADRDRRCVILPFEGYADKDGENALKSAMNTCFYYNNPVTRYIADAVAEKLTRDAAPKGDQHGENQH